VPGPDLVVLLTLPLAAFLPAPDSLLAYGPGPPIDLIPYFLALAGWAGLSLAAVLLSPLNALLRRLRRLRGTPPAAPKRTPMTASATESPHEDSHHKA
jgi:hypothetical protein